MKRALLFLTAGLLSLMLFGSLAGGGDMNLASKSQSDQNIFEVKTEVKAATGAIQVAAPAQPSPATVTVLAAEEEEEDQFGC